MARQLKKPNRFELKYLVRHDLVPEILAHCGSLLTPDANNAASGGYRIHSLYWDTKDFRCFWEKLDGEKFRRKLRFRRYADSSQVFLEIKQRIDRTVQKRRVSWPVERVREVFLSEAGGVAAFEPANQVEAEIDLLIRQLDLRPVLTTAYTRQAYFASNESDLRVTFDSRVQYHAHAPSLDVSPEQGKYAIAPELAILEIKFSEAVPTWLCRAAQQFELKVVRISKYCTAVDREFFQGRYT